MFGQQVVQHAGVLHAHEGAEHTHDAGWQAQIERHAVGLTGAGTGAGAENHLMAAEVGHDFLDDREHRRPAAVHHALTADFHHIGVGQNLPHGSGGLRQDGGIGERAFHQGSPQRGQQVPVHMGRHNFSSVGPGRTQSSS